MKYLTVGTNEITKELFREIEDTDPNNIKPRGGLWLTKYENEYYNEWIDYLLEDSVTFFYKSRGSSLWNQPCSLVTLKDSANIYQLFDENGLNFLKQNYHLDYDKFSYREISHIYDGMYIDIYKLMLKLDSDTRQRLYKFGVNSLILFNLNCIDFYQPGVVNIEPFDYEYGFCEVPFYEIKCDNTKKRILKNSD